MFSEYSQLRASSDGLRETNYFVFDSDAGALCMTCGKTVEGESEEWEQLTAWAFQQRERKSA